MIEMCDLSSCNLRKKRRLRVGRGNGSKGTTCGRGTKGAGSRSGYKRRFGYEGGNLPFFRRFPKRGFSRGNLVRVIAAVNLDTLHALFEEGEEVSFASLKAKGVLSGSKVLVKILSRGELTKQLSFDVHGFSKEALRKLSCAGISVGAAEQ